MTKNRRDGGTTTNNPRRLFRGRRRTTDPVLLAKAEALRRSIEEWEPVRLEIDNEGNMIVMRGDSVLTGGKETTHEPA